MKFFICVLFTLLVLIMGCLNCQSADKNITDKDIDCNVMSYANSVPCCLQFMSSSTGNDSKDVVCLPLVRELADHLKEDRQKKKYEFCITEPEFNTCLDKLNLK